MTMAELKPGRSGVIRSIGLTPERREGFVRLGLIPGTTVRCLHRSPLGDPTAYELRGTVFALRACDAGEIRLEPGGVRQ